MKIARDIGVLFITVLFAVMWGVLLRDNLSFDDSKRVTPNYEVLLPEDETEKRVEMGIYYGRSKIGQSVSKIKGEIDGIIVDNRTELRLGNKMRFLVSGFDKLEVHFRAHILEDSGIKSLQLRCRQLDIQLQGLQREGKLSIRGTIGGGKVKREVPTGNNGFFGQTLSPVSGFPDLLSLEPGRTWTVEIFNPLRGQFQDVTVKYKGNKTLVLPGKNVTVGVAVFSTGTRSWKSYVNARGEILVQGTPYGITFVRQELEDSYPDWLWNEDADQKSSGKSGVTSDTEDRAS